MTTRTLFARLRARRASVTVLAATMFPVLVGVAGLATEYGDALLTKLKAQRIADAASYSGALAYNQVGTTAAITAAASRVAALNGIPTADMSAALVNSPTSDGNSAVQATVTMSVGVDLTKLVSGKTSVSVTANSYVELKAGSGGIPCVIALKGAGGTGVTLSGSGKVTASACAVASNSTTNPAITAPTSSATVTTPVVSTAVALTPASAESFIYPPSGTASVNYQIKTISDPLASNTTVTTATSRLSTVALMGNPSAPSTPSGSSYSFGYTGPSTTMAVGTCTGTESAAYGGNWTVACSGAGPFNFGSITNGGATLTFNNATSATYNFSGAVTNSGSSLTFNGAGTYNIVQGLMATSGTTSFTGAGTFKIGQSTTGCGDGGKYSVCLGGSSLTFAGPSTFVFSNGIYNPGSGTITFGSGTTNSYQIGSSSNGFALSAAGSSKTIFNDATGSGDVFQMVGQTTTGGSSCLVFPAAAAHDINGSLNTAGATILGAGVYTMNGYVGIGAGGGGDSSCNGSTVGMTGSGVTFILSGTATPTSGTCSGMVFCSAAGYGHVTLTAPTATNLLVVGPTTSTNTAGASFAEGSSATSLQGAFYLPYGPFSMSGGASIGGGGCFQIVAAQVTLSGGTAVASSCSGLTGSSILPSSLVLVQ